MSMTGPDADELAVRNRLHQLIDGTPTPDTADAPVAPQPGADDWWDALYETPAPAPEPRRIPPWWTGRHVDLTPPAAADEDVLEADEDDTEPEEEPADSADGEDDDTADAQPTRSRIRIPARLHPRPATPRPAVADLVAAPAPRMSLLEAYGRIPPRLRWLGVHVSAAAAGYRLGWVQWSTNCMAWMHVHGWANPTAGFWAGAVIGCELLRRRLQDWQLPVRWAAAIPVVSLVTGALLYGTGWQNLELPL